MQKIKMAAQDIDHKQDVYHSTFMAVRAVYMLKQQSNESLDSYYRRFKAVMNTADMLKANTTSHAGILESEEQGARTNVEMLSACKEGYKAMIFLMNADYRTYNKLWKRLSESVTFLGHQPISTHRNICL